MVKRKRDELSPNLIDVVNPVDELLSKDLEASQVAQLAIAKVFTQKDFFSDMTEEQIIAYSVLVGLNEELESRVLGDFLKIWIIARKSKNRKSRKEAENLFRYLGEKIERARDILKERFGEGVFR